MGRGPMNLIDDVGSLEGVSTRSRILESAALEIERNGLTQFRVKRVASEADISVALLYSYFTDREDLPFALDRGDRDDRGFVQNDAAAFDIYQGIGGAEVNRHVGGHPTQKRSKHVFYYSNMIHNAGRRPGRRPI